jgi:hypothetical protein
VEKWTPFLTFSQQNQPPTHTNNLSEIGSTTPPPSKETIASAIGRDRHTSGKINPLADIKPSGQSVMAHAF